MELKRQLGVKYDTAWMLKHKLLQNTNEKESDDKQAISGIIQLDGNTGVASAVWWQTGSGRGRQEDAICGSSGPEQGKDINQDADDGGRWFQNQVRC